jgi:hypothetical protein
MTTPSVLINNCISCHCNSHASCLDDVSACWLLSSHARLAGRTGCEDQHLLACAQVNINISCRHDVSVADQLGAITQSAAAMTISSAGIADTASSRQQIGSGAPGPTAAGHAGQFDAGQTDAVGGTSDKAGTLWNLCLHSIKGLIPASS